MALARLEDIPKMTKEEIKEAIVAYDEVQFEMGFKDIWTRKDFDRYDEITNIIYKLREALK